MPHDAETIRQDVVIKTSPGGHDSVILTKYEAPSADDGIHAAPDPNKERDLEIAGTMMRWLNRHFPGYLWATVADTKQGIVKFNIPILMGICDWWVVNLRTDDIVDGMAKGAGQILERYRLPRHYFSLDAFLDARAKHSKLVVPTRLIPE
jgi:hypothetical protein